MKAGNRPEDKTRVTLHKVAVGHRESQKPLCLRRGEDKLKRVHQSTKRWEEKKTEAAVLRGTHKPGVTSQLVLAPAQAEYCDHLR